jgi:hypothetical protein
MPSLLQALDFTRKQNSQNSLHSWSYHAEEGEIPRKKKMSDTQQGTSAVGKAVWSGRGGLQFNKLVSEGLFLN